jgi:hypothetical protein
MSQTTDENDDVLAPVDQAGRVVTKKGVTSSIVGIVALVAVLLLIGSGAIGEVV